MEIREEEWTLEFFEETKDMMYEWLEGILPLNQENFIDHIAYTRANRTGELALFVPRVEGKAVGYLFYWIVNDVNHLSISAQQAGIFLKDEHRGRAAIEMIKYAEKVLKEKYEVNYIVHISTKRRDIGPLFKYLKYEEAETLYVKEI